ncbi:MAG: hypothetical protein RIC19_03465 [Phaeodactylibacter sp.]|uniref:hypothetical protein n=1 Tax=Phaeodactylibacter sp. TaxID=1940289 RepID=UPI0032EEC748
MTKREIRLPEALQLLANNWLDSSYSVEFSDSDQVEATDAIKLGAIGVDVPEACIYYDDANIADDEDFDGEWVPIESDVAHYKSHLHIQLSVDKEVEQWLASSDIDLDALVSELLTGFYRSSKAVSK